MNLKIRFGDRGERIRVIDLQGLHPGVQNSEPNKCNSENFWLKWNEMKYDTIM